MAPQTQLTAEEKKAICTSYKQLLALTSDLLNPSDIQGIRDVFRYASETADVSQYKARGFSSLLHSVQVSIIVADEIGLGRSSVIAAFLYDVIQTANIPCEIIKEKFGDSTVSICEGLVKVRQLYGKQLPSRMTISASCSSLSPRMSA